MARMPMNRMLLWLGAGCALMAGCAQDAEKPKTPTASAKIVGRIASIQPDRKFVLIQSYGKWEVASGTILVTRGPENRSANLRVTGETMGQYAAADLQAGAVEVGDAVMTRPEIKEDAVAASQPATEPAAGQVTPGTPPQPSPAPTLPEAGEPAPVDPKKKWPGEGWTDVPR